MELIKRNEVMQFQFYSVPKIFFVEKKYKKMSLIAKVIYSIYLDRLGLSQKNEWINNKEQVYLCFTRKEMADILGISEKTVGEVNKELKKYNLIYEERKGLGKPNLIYLSNFIVDEKEESENEKIGIQEKKFEKNKNGNNYTSENEENSNQENSNVQIKKCKSLCSETENNSVQEMKNLHTNNTEYSNTNYNNTEISQLKELEEIKDKCELHILEEQDEFGNVNYRKREMVENALEIMYFSQDIRVDNAIIPQELVRKKLKQLNGAKICYALDKLNTKLINTQNVTNTTKYLISCIYNAITEYYSDAEIQYKIDCLNGGVV